MPFKDFILEFKNRLDEQERISKLTPEDIAKKKEEDKKEYLMASKAKWRIATGAKSKEMMAALNSKKVKAPSRKKEPPKNN